MTKPIKNPLAYLKPKNWPVLGTSALAFLAHAQHAAARPLDTLDAESLALSPSAAGSQAVALAPAFVRPVSDSSGRIMLGINNMTTPLMGFNMPMPDAPVCGISRTDYTQILDTALAQAPFNIVRLWMYQTAGGPGNWAAFDYAIAEAKRRNIKIIAPLVNMWADCETGRVTKGLSWFQGDYKQPDAGYTLSYRDYAAAVMRRYANEPTIAMWQLANEPDANSGTPYCPDENLAFAALKGFATDMLQVSREAGVEQLVAFGLQAGLGNCGLNGTHWLDLQRGFGACTVNQYGVDVQLLQQRVDACTSIGLATQAVEAGACRGMQVPPGSEPNGGYFSTSQGNQWIIKPYAVEAVDCPGMLDYVPTPATELNNDTAYRTRWLTTRVSEAIAAGTSGAMLWQLTTPGHGDTFGIYPTEATFLAFANFTQEQF